MLKWSLVIAGIAIIGFTYRNIDLAEIIDRFVSNSPQGDTGLFTAAQLAEYNGIQRKEIYLSLMGNVYDVSKGSEHYGPGGSYSFFVGRDATNSFLTGREPKKGEGDFTLKGLKTQDFQSLEYWDKFLAGKYARKGKLVGLFYDKNGGRTDFGALVQSLIADANEEEARKEAAKAEFPPCNVEWSAETQLTRLWCSSRSGGVLRDWTGVPRQLFLPSRSSPMCVCVRDPFAPDPRLRQYEGCPVEDESCYYKPLPLQAKNTGQ